jgi:biopolymer transport protein ExbB
MNTPTLDTARLWMQTLLEQTDGVGLALFSVLVVMSITSWSVIAVKAVAWRQHQKLGQKFLNFFDQASTLQAVATHINSQGGAAPDPFSQLTSQALHAQAHHAQYASGQRGCSAVRSGDEFVMRALKKTLSEEATRGESGLAVLATVGSTAPFVGLLGTVWGIHHALANMGLKGASTLNQVAGPVGEALVMTALGLVVAIPASMAYNAFIRAHRLRMSRLSTLAHELQTFVMLGQPLGKATRNLLQPEARLETPQLAPLKVSTLRNAAA